MRGEIIKDDRDDNETGKLSQHLVSDVALLFSPLMPSNHCNDIDTTSNTACDDYHTDKAQIAKHI
ncbi:hypothetical protein FOTG_08426 [Fusarium oxysporum f. sp. vasinfectum 25433]|uniref:Uncharacterized protein n=1 Tax=Fusarium oxysporum f. sp. vasinfectum 25433 TaxID=1089449 RepID=X0LT96_FUSOX|nr:hypothetical protein FOTG_08426 [Fusarium oxysporum f. sp. vasinfectum 25433]